MANSHKQCAYKPCGAFERVEIGVTMPNRKFFCQPGHAVQWAQENAQKAAESRRRKAAKKAKAEKRARKSGDLPHQIELTQRVFNTFIRMIDRGKTCPTCGEPLIDGWYDAGHVRTVAACPQLRYDPRACFGQCRSCNGSGTIRRRTRKTQELVSDLYRAWILETWGQAYYDWLYGPHDSPHWTVDDLAAMRKVYAAETRRLERGEQLSRDWRAVSALEQK